MPLTLDDIADSRAYERERESTRAQIIALKKLRRVHVGPVVSMVFENADTVRFQIQEMARVEKLCTDSQIQTELDIYNPLVPENGNLCATLFIECTAHAEMREWLPKLVGIESSVRLTLCGEGTQAASVVAAPEASHAAQLTRSEITSAVHYVFFGVGRLDFVPVRGVVAVEHQNYSFSTPLNEATLAELAKDLNG